jgi:hypothetical protein
MRLLSTPRRAPWGGFAAVAISVSSASLAGAQSVPVRNYNVNRTTTAPVADGVVSPGEWGAAATAAGSWGVLRETAADVDTENNRFRIMWDDTNLYVLYETDFNQFVAEADPVNVPRPNISFSPDVLNLYIDPNEDNDPNFVTDPDEMVDGYQFAFNQFRGPAGSALISTDADRQGVGIYTEAHAGVYTGDQAKWNKNGSDVQGGGMQNIVVGQKNGATGGVAEVIWPWANFNAQPFTAGASDASDFNTDGLVDGTDVLIWQKGLGPNPGTDKSTGDANLDFVVDGADLELWTDAYGTDTRVETGLEATEGPTAGDIWFFNMCRQNGLGDAGNFLPLWNWHEGQAFAPRPHGTLTFIGPAAAGAAPEPTALALAMLGGVTAGSMLRRRARGR